MPPKHYEGPSLVLPKEGGREVSPVHQEAERRRGQLNSVLSNLRHRGELPDAQVQAEVSIENCSPFDSGSIKVFLKVTDDGIIERAAFTHSQTCCRGATAAAEMLCASVEGKTVQQALAIKEQQFKQQLPIESVKPCQTMALTAMKKGIRAWRKSQGGAAPETT